ncbi:MAG TPA: hypothetical protein VMH02_12145 [Verrucomicrobiae bacterium]|nr:hypothetical protein [Verrucomicrobiae bacterium]
MSTTTYGREESAILKIETAGSVVEAATGIAVIVLAIIGLAHADSSFFGSIGAIVLGAALLAQGGAVAAEYSKLLSMISGGALGAIELGAGMSVEILAGGAMIVLGILGLLGFYPATLLASGVIVIGAALVLAANGLARLATLKGEAAGLSELAQRVAEAALAGAVTAQVLAGGAAVVLGILALTMTGRSDVLALVGLLVLGAAVAVSGTALTGRMLRLFNLRQL